MAAYGAGNPVITNGSTLGLAVTSIAYNQTMAATSGTTPYTWTATGLPTGLSINGSTGIISGTPAIPGVSSSITITVTDAAAAQGTGTFSLTTIAGPLAA